MTQHTEAPSIPILPEPNHDPVFRDRGMDRSISDLFEEMIQSVQPDTSRSCDFHPIDVHHPTDVRKERNRLSAQQSRRRKQEELENLKRKLEDMENELDTARQENKLLRKQLLDVSNNRAGHV